MTTRERALVGLVDDASNSLVGEIGHTSHFPLPAGPFCLPGSATKPPCSSYNVPTWTGVHPLISPSVPFGEGRTAKSSAAVSNFGGKAAVHHDCGATNDGTPFCWYPCYACNKTLGGFPYGGLCGHREGFPSSGSVPANQAMPQPVRGEHPRRLDRVELACG